MTGIIAAVTSKNEIAPIILKGLKKIRSRNHEVSGISLLSKNRFNSIKTSGNIELLDKTTKEMTSKIGMAYTGWLYGEDIKSLSPIKSKNFSITFNGIIENYSELKELVQKKGFKVKSNKESEIILHLLEYYNRKYPMIKIIRKVTKLLEGCYALIIMSKKESSTLWATKNDSPLIIGKLTNHSILASDSSVFDDLDCDLFYMKNNEISKIESNEIIFFNIKGKRIKINNVEKKYNIVDCYKILKNISKPSTIKEAKKKKKIIEFIKNNNIHLVLFHKNNIKILEYC